MLMLDNKGDVLLRDGDCCGLTLGCLQDLPPVASQLAVK